jgi:hypothetical protein
MLCYNSPPDYHPGGASYRQTLEVKLQQYIQSYTNQQPVRIYRDGVFVVAITYIILYLISVWLFIIFLWWLSFLNYNCTCEKIEQYCIP